MLFTNSIKFNTSGWEPLEKAQRITLNLKSDHCLVWKNDVPDLLSLNFFPLPPDIPVDLNSLGELRNFYRESVQQAGGGLVSVDRFSIQGVSTIQTLFKFPQKPHGMVYIGSLIFPFVDFSYAIKVQCQEYGVTGMRDAIIFALHHQSLPIEVDQNQQVKGWLQDPYDPTRQDPVMRNLSEDEKYDVDFPSHPLSRTRQYLAKIRSSLEFSREILQLVTCEQDLCR